MWIYKGNHLAKVNAQLLNGKKKRVSLTAVVRILTLGFFIFEVTNLCCERFFSQNGPKKFLRQHGDLEGGLSVLSQIARIPFLMNSLEMFIVILL